VAAFRGLGEREPDGQVRDHGREPPLVRLDGGARGVRLGAGRALRREEPLALGLRLLPVVDVDRAAEPADDLRGLGVAVRLGAHQEPAVLAGGRADAVLDLEDAAGAPRLVEARHRHGAVLRMHRRRRDLRRRRGLEGRAGVGRPLPVEELRPAVRVGDPDDLRDGVGHDPEPRLALAQRGLGRLAVLDVAEVAREAAAHGVRVEAHVDPAAHDGRDGLEVGGASLAHDGEVLRVRLAVHGLRELGPVVPAEQRLARPAPERLGLPVHVGEPEVGVDGVERVADALERGGDPRARRLALRQQPLPLRGGGAELGVGPLERALALPARLDVARRLEHGGQDPGGPVRLVRDRAVGEREVRLLGDPRLSPALGREELVLEEDRGAGVEHALVHRPDHGPQLGPAVAGALAEAGRVLGLEHAAEGVVVELHELRAPHHEHREARREAEGHRRAQTLRPAFHGPERGRRPVECAAPRPHLAGAGEESRPVVHPPIGAAPRRHFARAHTLSFPAVPPDAHRACPG
jgi:hypothetical protein